MKMKLKTGDEVVVIAGKDKGKTGKITQVIPKEQRIVVDGVNKTVRHIRSPRRDQQGQKVEFFGPIHVSNVMMITPKSKKRTRVSVATEGSDKKRVSKKYDEDLS